MNSRFPILPTSQSASPFESLCVPAYIAQESSDDDQFHAKVFNTTCYLGSSFCSTLCLAVTSSSRGAPPALPPFIPPSLPPSLQLHPSLTGGSESQVSTSALAMRAPCKDFQATRPILILNEGGSRTGLQAQLQLSMRGLPSGVDHEPGTWTLNSNTPCERDENTQPPEHPPEGAFLCMQKARAKLPAGSVWLTASALSEV